MVEAIVLLVAIGKVAVLEVVNVKVAPNQEGAVVGVAYTSVAVVSGTRISHGGRRYRSPPCSLLARTWGGNRASLGTSVQLDCQS